VPERVPPTLHFHAQNGAFAADALQLVFVFFGILRVEQVRVGIPVGGTGAREDCGGDGQTDDEADAGGPARPGLGSNLLGARRKRGFSGGHGDLEDDGAIEGRRNLQAERRTKADFSGPCYRMKSAFCSWLGLVVVTGGLVSSLAAQSFDYSLTAGFLYEANSSTKVPVDSLLLLVDTGSGALGSLTAGGSVAEGGMLNSSTVVLQQFATGDGLESQGTVANAAGTIDYSVSVKAGDNLAIVWVPQLNFESTTLTAGLNYGSFTGVAGTDGSAWVVPTDSGDPLNPASVSLDFETDALSGNNGVHSESVGQANSLVLDAVPEPASSALICGAAALGVAVLRTRSTRRLESRSDGERSGRCRL
jgi:hypothetical protein